MERGKVGGEGGERLRKERWVVVEGERDGVREREGSVFFSMQEEVVTFLF